MANSEQVIYVNMNTEGVRSATEDLEKELLVLRLAFGKLKAEIKRAIAPIGAVFIPVVQKAVWAATRITRSVGKVIAALFGYDKAVKVVTKTNEKVKRSLMGFDEINRLSESADADMADVYEESAGTLSPKLQAVVDKILSLIAPLKEIDFAPAVAAFGRLKEAIAPLKQTLFAGLQWAWHNLLVPLAAWSIENVLPVFLDALTTALQALNETIVKLRPVADWLWAHFLKPLAQWAGEKVIAALGDLQQRLDGLMNPISLVSGAVKGLGGVVLALITNWRVMKTVAVEAWDTIRTGWAGITDWLQSNLLTPISGDFKDTVNGIIGFLNGLLDGVIAGVNGVVEAVNKLRFTVPDWIPGIGGKNFGFDLKMVSTPKIPYLAQGAVLPANRPFMAVVGDQRHGTNIEAPLQTIKQALSEVLGSRDSETVVQVNFSGDLAQLARVLKPAIELETRRRGGSLVKGGVY